MSEGKSVDPVEKMFKECGIPVKMVDCTSPPTDSKRSDVEEILKQATAVAPFGHGTDNASTISLCGHILAVEKERDVLKAKLDLLQVDVTKLTGDSGFANSHLAMLVEAAEQYKQNAAEGPPLCGLDVLTATLTAAKQHLKAAKTVLEGKSK